MKPSVNKLIILMFLIIMSDFLYAGGFSIDANRFKSTPFEDGYFSVYGAEGLDENMLGIGFIMNYMPDSISQFNAEGDIIRSVIKNQITADISFFYSPVKYFDFGLVLPVMIYQNGDGWDDNDSLPSGGIGDIRLVPRFQIANVSEGLFALSLIPEMTIPTGELVHSALGNSLFTFKPAIAIGSESKWVGFTTNLFYQILQKQYYANSVFDDEFGVKVALNLHAVPQLFDIVAEFHANTSIADPFKNEAVDNIELGGGFKVKTPVDLDISAGAYGGFGNAVGTPKFRVLFGITWSMDISKKQVETPKPEPKPEPEVKEQPKPEVKEEPKPEPKPEVQPEVKEEPKPEVKPEPKPEVKPEPKPEVKPAPQPVAPRTVKKTGEKLSSVVTFMHNSDYIQDALEIEKVAMILNRNYVLKIRIEAHRDPSEKSTYPQKRADAVKAVLIKNGVEASRIIIKLMGASEPVATGDTEPDMVKNRRVEFYMLTE